MKKLTKRQSKMSSYKPRANLEDWLNREEEKREFGERNLPINEMDDLLPIYDTDGLPFEEEGVFNDVDGMTAPPSEATIEKALGIKPSRYAGMPPLTVSEGSLKDMLYGVTDYHEAMLDQIARMHEGDPVWTFKNQTKIQRKLDMYSFVYAQQIREFYNLDKKNTYYIEDLKEIIKEYGKTLPTPVALRILALEQSDKEWFKSYMPSSMYKAIKKQVCKSLDLADKDYIAKGGKDPEIRKKALESTIKEIRL